MKKPQNIIYKFCFLYVLKTEGDIRVITKQFSKALNEVV